MKVESEKSIKLKIKGKDVDDFKSAIKKMSDQTKQIGFSNHILNEDEIKVIQSLSEKIKSI